MGVLYILQADHAPLQTVDGFPLGFELCPGFFPLRFEFCLGFFKRVSGGALKCFFNGIAGLPQVIPGVKRQGLELVTFRL